MNKSRRIGVVVAASAAAMGMTAVGMAAPASAGGHGDDYGQGPRPVSSWLRSVQANSSSWIAINWRSSSRVCDVQIRITGGRNVDVDYTSNRSYGSLAHGGGSLWAQNDYSAVRVTPDYDRSGIALLRTMITYKNCGGSGGAYGVGASRHKSYWLTLPVACTDNGRGNGRGNGGPVFHGGGNGHGQWDDRGQWNGHNGGGNGHGQWDDRGQWNGHNGGGNGHGQGGHSNGGGSGHGNGGGSGSGHSNGGGSGSGHSNGGGSYQPKKLADVKS